LGTLPSPLLAAGRLKAYKQPPILDRAAALSVGGEAVKRARTKARSSEAGRASTKIKGASKKIKENKRKPKKAEFDGLTRLFNRLWRIQAKIQISSRPAGGIPS
jgi:hypothetical protein